MPQAVRDGVARGSCRQDARRPGHSPRTLSFRYRRVLGMGRAQGPSPGYRGVVTGRRPVRQLPGGYRLAKSANRAPLQTPNNPFGPADVMWSRVVRIISPIVSVCADALLLTTAELTTAGSS
jgi:hypothetical protein